MLDAGRELVAERPLTNAQLRDALAKRWPERDPAALAYAVRGLLPMVHVPPRGIWQRSGPIALTTVEAWLGRPVDEATAPDAMVLRYLAAYGPVERGRRPGVVAADRAARGVRAAPAASSSAFRDERGRELFDLPDAPRPDPDTPAPPRFLPEYDNVLLAHADRTRFVDDDLRRLVTQEGLVVGSVLVDGVVGATWTTERQPEAATLVIRPLVEMPDEVRGAVADEAARLLAFLAPAARAARVEFARLTAVRRRRRRRLEWRSTAPVRRCVSSGDGSHAPGHAWRVEGDAGPPRPVEQDQAAAGAKAYPKPLDRGLRRRCGSSPSATRSTAHLPRTSRMIASPSPVQETAALSLSA